MLRRIVIVCSLALPLFAQSVVDRKGAALESPAHNTDHAIVEFREPLQTLTAAPQRARKLEADLARIAGARVRRVYTRAFNGAAVTIPRGSWDAVAKLPYVKRVHPDAEVRAFLSRSVPQVGAPQLWASRATRGSGTVIAIIDTGVDYRHPALGGGIGAGFRITRGFDFVNDDSDPMDDHGHGTHVAGIAAANSPTLTGVAPDATLLAYKVLDGGGRGYASAVIAAIDRAVDPDGDGNASDAADVINLSFGGPGAPDDPVAQAVERAVAHGVVVVAAAGNDWDYFRIGSPACAPNAITVGNAELEGAINYSSSKGPNTGAVHRRRAVRPSTSRERAGRAEAGGAAVAVAARRYTSLMARAAALREHDDATDSDHIVVLHDVSWDDYERLLAMRGDHSAPRISYLEGEVEIMSPSKDHELIKSYIGRLLEAWCVDRGIDFTPVGSWTLKKKSKRRGAEADESYIFGSKERSRPHLAIEVEWTHGGIDKLAIYEKLGLDEVWFWRKGVIEVYVLSEGTFTRMQRSRLLPELDLELVASMLDRDTLTQAVRDFRKALGVS